MRFGISTYAFAWSIGVPGFPVSNPMTPWSFYEAAVALGAEVIQIADNLPLHKMPAHERKTLLMEAKQAGVAIEVGARGMTPDNLSNYMAIATEMESPILRMVVDSHGYEPDLNEIRALLAQAIPELTARNIMLAIENHDRFLVSDYSSMLAGMDTNRIGICLDTVNSFGAGQGVDTVVEALAPYTINLHVKDFRIQRLPHQMGFTILGAPAGQGQLPIADIVMTLNKFDRCQSAILENWVIPAQEMNTTVREELRWAQEASAFLRPLLQLQNNSLTS